MGQRRLPLNQDPRQNPSARRGAANSPGPAKLTPPRGHTSQAQPAARAPAGHGFSNLKNWRVLTRLRRNPGQATTMLRALPS